MNSIHLYSSVAYLMCTQNVMKSYSYSDPMFRPSLTSDPSVSPPSSSESGGDENMIKESSIDRVMGHIVTRPGATTRLPPLPPSPPIRLSSISKDSAK